MKRILLFHDLKRGKTRRFTGLILCLVLSTGLSGQNFKTILIETWNAGNWVGSVKQTNTYDVNGYLTNGLTKNWDIPSSTWINDSQSNYTNNTDGSINQIINQSWNTGISQWTNSERTTFTNSIPTGSPESNSDELYVIYPNPAHDAITIKVKQVISTSLIYHLTDQTGRQVLTGKIAEETTSLDINKLPNGIYFLRLGTGPRHTFKVIKK